MKEFIDLAKELTEVSSSIIMKYFNNKNFSIDEKQDKSPVTIADKESEKAMREIIQRNFPEHGIIGEEYGNFNTEAEFVWVLDPIDGTKSFIHDVPIFGTLIALLQNNKPILGVINHPALQEMVIGVKGKPTLLNGSETKIKDISNISDAVMLCTDILDVVKYRNINSFLDLAKSVKLYRGWGDCYMYTLLAKGSIDIAIDPVMNYWDIQALIPIIEGAGGIITDYHGNKAEEATSIVASSKNLHNTVIKMLK